MNYANALIAWIPNTKYLRVGPLVEKHLRNTEADWTVYPVRYPKRGGAATWTVRNTEDDNFRMLMLYREFVYLVTRAKIPTDIVHEAFMQIDEYREFHEVEGQGEADEAAGIDPTLRTMKT